MTGIWSLSRLVVLCPSVSLGYTYLGVESLGHRNVHVQFSEVMRQYQSVFHLTAFPRVSEMIVSPPVLLNFVSLNYTCQIYQNA